MRPGQGMVRGRISRIFSKDCPPAAAAIAAENLSFFNFSPDSNDIQSSDDFSAENRFFG